MTQPSDPRVFFAAERTLLAWLRTGVSIVGLGFVVSRFGLFLRVVGQQSGTKTDAVGSAEIGIALVVLGALAILGATLQHVRFMRALPLADQPTKYWGGFAVGTSAAVTFASLILAAYLLFV